MGYMKSKKLTTRGWWEDHSDPAKQRAALAAYRAAQRDERAAAWRRNLMLGLLAIAAPFLIRMLTAA
jgi:hypothetical protein